MSTYTQVREWVAPLSNFASGVSIASLFLVSPVGYATILVEQASATQHFELVTTIPDGALDFRTMYFRTSYGLETIAPQTTPQMNSKIESDNTPATLRDITGLPVETLATLAKVSRNAYYKWLDGGGVSDEHGTRLTELLDTFRTLQVLCGTHLKEFLETTSSTGRPIDLLAIGNNDVVIGLALRPLSLPTGPASVSDTARNSSGLPGWLRPISRLNWDAPHLTDVESDEALDQLRSQPLSESEERYSSTDEAFVAWGFFWE